jgi:hypothetical protein
MLSPGNLDLNVQVDQLAIDAVLSGILFDLKQRGANKFTAALGPASLEIDITALQVTNIHAVNPADRFAGTLATFIIDADATLTIPSIPNFAAIKDKLVINLDDLEVGVSMASGIPTGIQLGFAQFRATVTGLTFLAVLLNGLAALLSVVVSTALAPLGLIPIAIHQMADVFIRLGVLFAANFPKVAQSLSGNGLVGLADFQNAQAHVSDFRAATDLFKPASPIAPATTIAPASQLTAAAQINERAANAALGIAFAKGYLPRFAPIGGIWFGLTDLSVSFLQPVAPSTARMRISFSASGKIKKNLCGSLGSFFGLSRSVKIYIWGDVTADGEIVPPNPSLNFTYDANVQAKVSISQIYAVVLGIVLGPQLFIILLLLVQVLNILASAVLPQALANVQIGPANVNVNLQNLQLGLTLFGITASAQVGGTGAIDLNPLVQLATAKFPMQISFPADGLASQLLPTSGGQGDLLIGAQITPP